MMECMSEQERYENGALAHEIPVFTPEQISLRSLINKIGVTEQTAEPAQGQRLTQ